LIKLLGIYQTHSNTSPVELKLGLSFLTYVGVAKECFKFKLISSNCNYLFQSHISDIVLTTPRHGNGARWDGFYIPRSHTRFSHTYPLPYRYPTGMRNWTPSPYPTGSGIPAPSPSPHWINFLNKNYKFFLQPLEKCCNSLSSNMLTLTFVRLIDLVALLNINGNFYNTEIIKQNNMTYQHKIIFCI